MYASPMACGHRFNEIFWDLEISSKKQQSTTGNIRQVLHASAVAWTYQLGDIVVSLHACTSKLWTTTENISEDHHASNMVCAHLPSDIWQWHVAFSKTCTHNTRNVCIIWVISMLLIEGTITQGICATVSNIGQWKQKSTKAYTHFTLHACIWNAKFGNEVQDLKGVKGPPRVACGVFESVGRHIHRPSSISFLRQSYVSQQ